MSNRRQVRRAAFTLVEVMMAATILAVAFMGLIDALGISSEMMDSGRRQSLAAAILNHEMEVLRFSNWSTISNLPTTQTVIGQPWSASKSYLANEPVTYGGNWYRSAVANSGQNPTSANIWRKDNPPYADILSDSFQAYGAVFTVSRAATSPDPETNLREVQLVVTWVVTTNRQDDAGLPVKLTYTRTQWAYIGKYGLNLTYQRS